MRCPVAAGQDPVRPGGGPLEHRGRQVRVDIGCRREVRVSEGPADEGELAVEDRPVMEDRQPPAESSQLDG